MQINWTMVAGVLRHVLTTAGGVLVTDGYISADTLNTSVGAIITLGGAGWSIWEKWKATKEAKALAAKAGAFAGCMLLAWSLTACASQEAQTPAQRVYAAQADYNALLKIAVAYESQPRCKTEITLKCSDVKVVSLLRQADNDAWAAIKVAQDTVRAPQLDSGVWSKALLGVTAALRTLRLVLINHGILKEI